MVKATYVPNVKCHIPKPHRLDYPNMGNKEGEDGNRHQEGRFARTRGSDQAERLALPYFERNPAQDMDSRRSAPEAEIDAGEPNER